MVALVIGGAQCVFDDIEAALKLFTPSTIVAVKDIGITYPHIDHWATYHPDRMPRELEQRRKLGLNMPVCVWTYDEVKRIPNFPVPVQRIKQRGGSSGLLGVLAGLRVADKVVCAGIPMDATMPHFHKRKNGRAWSEAKLYRSHWLNALLDNKHRVRSMSGWTRATYGFPTESWLAEMSVCDDSPHQGRRKENAR